MPNGLNWIFVHSISTISCTFDIFLIPGESNDFNLSMICSKYWRHALIEKHQPTTNGTTRWAKVSPDENKYTTNILIWNDGNLYCYVHIYLFSRFASFFLARVLSSFFIVWSLSQSIQAIYIEQHSTPRYDGWWWTTMWRMTDVNDSFALTLRVYAGKFAIHQTHSNNSIFGRQSNSKMP